MDGEPSNNESYTRPSSSRLQVVKLTAADVPDAEQSYPTSVASLLNENGSCVVVLNSYEFEKGSVD